MRFFDLPRIPLPEAPSESELDGPAAAAALRHLEELDDDLVRRALGLGVASGAALDTAAGQGQIAIKLALGNTSLVVHAIDASDANLRRAAMDASSWGVDMRILLNRGDAGAIPYDDKVFDLVLSNEVLHRSADPVRLIREMDRVCRPGGALLLRDYRRPSRVLYRRHVAAHGRFYEGKVRERFESSVRAAYTLVEVQHMVRESRVAGLEVHHMGPVHLGFERHTD